MTVINTNTAATITANALTILRDLIGTNKGQDNDRN